MKKSGVKPAKVGAIFLVAIMAMAAIGASYAHWQEILTIGGVMNTDDINPIFAVTLSNDDPDSVLADRLDPTDCGSWDGEDWYGLDRRDKDVGSTDVFTTNNDQTLNIAINDAYPCYYSHVLYYIRNTGSCPALVHSPLMLEELSIQTDPQNPSTRHVIDVDDMILRPLTLYYFDIFLDGTWQASITTNDGGHPENFDFSMYPTGDDDIYMINYQLDPWDWKNGPSEHMQNPGEYDGELQGDLCIHFENGCLQNVIYDFNFGMTYWNWPEFCTPPTTHTENYPESGNVYIGYEDWYNGDFDYNDFGMTFSVTEVYNANYELLGVTMTFEAVVFDSGMRHLIHIARPFNGGYTYTVTRSTPAYPNVLTLWDGATGQEKAGGSYSGTGPLDVTLFNTAKYTYPQKQIGETVIVDVLLDDPSLNPKTVLTPPRSYDVGSGDFYDLDPIMANYDPWEEGTLYSCRFHIQDTQVISSTSNQNGEVIPIGTETPMILVVPHTDWIPPFESTTITGPYGLFNDFYTTGLPTNWYETITNPTVGPGGLSWS